MSIKYVSLCSGIEAASVAWDVLGFEPLAFAEVEPYPSAVLAHRYPDVPNLGDIANVDWSKYRGTAQLVVGGTPCQSFSISGKRGGLMDPRGQLMLEYVRAVREIQPRWLLWENVPGVLSQDKGRAFGTLLSELDELGYGLAWRVLDSQFFGVPQRRRRVFLVGCFGSGGGASAVLFEREGVFGHPTSSRKKREELAASIGRGAQGTGGGIAFAQNQRGEVRLAGGDGTVSVALASRHTNQQTHIAESRIKKDTQATHVSTDDIGPEELRTMAHDDRDAQPMVMASANSHAEIGTGGVAPTLTAHNLKDPPILVTQSQATEMTFSRRSAQQMETSSSSTTNPSEAEGSCSNQGSCDPDPICVASDTQNAAIDVNLSGSLKVGGVSRSLHFV